MWIERERGGKGNLCPKIKGFFQGEIQRMREKGPAFTGKLFLTVLSFTLYLNATFLKKEILSPLMARTTKSFQINSKKKE